MSDSDIELCYMSAAQALEGFRKHTVSPVEILQAQINRAEQVNPKINAFADTYFEEALVQAREAEARYMKTDGRLRPLEGLSCVVKDELKLKGKRTTSGSLIFKDSIDDTTAVMVERLQDAGAIFHARTTTPEFCLSGTTASRIWGITRNPHNLEFTPGGSSGGTGASLAAGTTTLGTGTDIGGSIRIPASCCGIVGLKASYGRIPEIPVFNLDFYSHSGPMTRTVEDCRLMFNVINGHSLTDIASLREKLELAPPPKSIKGWKVAYSADLGYFQIDDEVRNTFLSAIDKFRELGCEVEEVDIPWTIESEHAAEAWFHTLWGQHMKPFLAEHRDIMTDYAIKFIEAAENTTNADYMRSIEVAVEMYDFFGPMMENYDVFLCPTNALPAVKADHDTWDENFTINGVKTNPENGWLLSYPFNMLSRCPAMSVPSGKAQNGVPIGLQIVGKTYDELSVFQAASAFETLCAFEHPTGI